MLTRGIDANLARPGPLAAVASNADDPGRFFEDFCNWQRITEYERIMRDSALPAIAAALMQSATARIYHDHLLVKEAGTQGTDADEAPPVSDGIPTSTGLKKFIAAKRVVELFSYADCHTPVVP